MVNINPNNFMPMGYEEASDTFTSCINNMSNNCKNLSEEFKSKGYTEEDISLLVCMVFDVENFMEEFIGRGDTSTFLADTCFRYLQSNLKGDKSAELFTSASLKNIFDIGSKYPVYDMLTVDADRVPLYINGSEIEKVMVKWRLAIGK